ncbi:acetyltransferase [Spirochaetia bacterium]|nr:acetyltransferase [Spirochaetia bacterium]
MKMILETNRLYLREMDIHDLPDLSKILQDPEVMYAYEHPFSDEELIGWYNQQVERYKKDGHGLWAVILKETDAFIGQCGLTIQTVEGDELLEVGYLFNKNYWHQGYAAEAARACKTYAFEKLGAKKVCSIIRTNNRASQKVAERNGMKIVKETIKHYYNMEMPHYVYEVST